MIEARFGFGGRDVVAALDRIIAHTETPLSITVDHGTELTSKALEDKLRIFPGVYTSDDSESSIQIETECSV